MNSIQGLLAATRRGLGPLKGLVSASKAEKPAVAPVSRPNAPLAAEAQKAVSDALSSIKVVMASGLYKTAAGVVGQRVIKENAGLLRGYLTVQLRCALRAEKALIALEDGIEHGRADELSKGPTKRSGLFLAAKNLVEYERLFGEGSDEPLSAVPWSPTPPGRVDDWGRALDEVRFGLGGAEAEILQLHHACNLDVRELSYVLGVPKSDVERRIEAGAAYAKLLVDDVLGRDAPALAKVLLEAYAVEGPTAEQIAAAKPKLVPLPAGTVISDRYEIDSLLGGGEFAFVYRARDIRVPGHVVALKLLHRVARTPAAREGAIRELSLIASAFHPALVQFKDHGWFEERLWFVMPFYEGEMLLERLDRGSLSVDEALVHFEKLSRALAALHAAGIRHQDIKPENIYLVSLSTGANADVPEVLPVLLDLGVASPSGEMALAGTPMYFPPEIAGRIFDEECELPLTPKADVFSLALSLLHSIEAPDFSIASPATEEGGFDIDAFLRARARMVPEGPRARSLKSLRPLFDRWLSFQPSERPTAGELADEIAQLIVDRRGRRGARFALDVSPRVSTALTALALMSIVGVCALVTDSPIRPVVVTEGAAAAATGAGTNEVVSESDQLRLLRHRVDTEERRTLALEDELARLRRQELRLDEPASRTATPTD